MAGITDASALNEAKSADECVQICEAADPGCGTGIRYARVFAEVDGRGPREADAFQACVEAYGTGQADSIKAMCWFLHWGSFTGNTLNTFFGLFGKTKSKRADADTLFMAAFTAYYFVMFYGIIGLVGLVLKQCPKVPKPVNMVFGVVLATLAGGLGFVPVGLLGMLVGAKDPFENKKAD